MYGYWNVFNLLFSNLALAAPVTPYHQIGSEQTDYVTILVLVMSSVWLN